MRAQRHSASPAQTESAGEDLAGLLEPGDVVLLSGPLGAGKTTFAKGVARGLGVLERVTSPTFTIVRPHECHNERGVAVLYHADLYRVASIDEVADLALGELLEEDAVALIEWGEIGEDLFGQNVWRLQIADEAEGRALVLEGPARAGWQDWAR